MHTDYNLKPEAEDDGPCACGCIALIGLLTLAFVAVALWRLWG